jgi:hypothetical protein
MSFNGPERCRKGHFVDRNIVSLGSVLVQVLRSYWGRSAESVHTSVYELSRSQTALLGAPRLPCVAGSGLKSIDFGAPVGIKIHVLNFT